MKKLILLVTMLFFVGCEDIKNQVTPPLKSSLKYQNQKDLNSNTIPDWISNPNKPNQICSVGSSPNNNQAKQKALIKAKANISSQIELFVHKQSSKQTLCKNNECKSQYKTFSRQIASNMLNNIKIVDTFIDNQNNNYYLRACTIKDDREFEYKKLQIHPMEVTKKACLLQSNYPNMTLIEQQEILVQYAKQKAVNELYGELIISKTEYLNGKLKSNTINQSAIGMVRTKGEPYFYQGQNLGEICVDVRSYITKDDIRKYKQKDILDESNLQGGLMATFYIENDFNLKNPIYQTYISDLDMQYKKLPFNAIIKKDTPYFIKITGYVKSDARQQISLKLYENLYSAKLFINKQQVLSRKKDSAKVTLKSGFNPLKLVIKTANAYDMRIVGLDQFYTNKF